MNTIAFNAAKRQVRLYRRLKSRQVRRYRRLESRRGADHAGVLRAHDEAMECRDCEDLLQVGIDAFRWLRRAQGHIQADVQAGNASYDHRLETAMTALYESWLRPCAFAEEWIQVQIDRGYRPDNLDTFRQCCAETRDIVEKRSLAHVARDSRVGASTGDAENDTAW